MTTHESSLSPIEAFESLSRFAQLRGRDPLFLAMHAAVPEGFRLDMLPLLRRNFLPYSAADADTDADVMLSSLCQNLGGGYFRFDSEIRRILVDNLREAYADETSRVARVAEFLLAYVDHQRSLAHTHEDRLFDAYLEAQRWTALAFLKPDDAAEQLAEALRDATGSGGSTSRVRLGNVTSVLSLPLNRYQVLLDYAKGVQSLQTGDAASAQYHLGRVGQREVTAGKVTLEAAAHLLRRSDLQDLARREERGAEPRVAASRTRARSLRAHYKLAELTFLISVTVDSVLVGKTIAESRIGVSTGLIILALERYGRSEALPNRQTVLRTGDGILVQGRLDQFRELRRWSDLIIEREAPVLKSMVSSKVAYAEVTVADGSPLKSELIRQASFRSRFNVAVFGIRRRDNYRLTNLAYVPLRAGDRVLVQGEIEAVEELEKFADFTAVERFTEDQLSNLYKADERMFVVRVPKPSELAEVTLSKSRLANFFDIRITAIFRDGVLNVMPRGDENVSGGDLLLVEGRPEDLEVMLGLQELEIETRTASNLSALDSERLTLADATLDPRSSLVGKTVGELNFRERYGVEIAGILREGETIGTELAEVRLQIGDALLMLGPRDRLQLLDGDPDSRILTPLGEEPPTP